MSIIAMSNKFNILKTGSNLWKLAHMHGFTLVERRWGMKNGDETFVLMFGIDGSLSDKMRGCADEARPVSTAIDIKFKVENEEDIDGLSNDKIFDAIADVVEKEDVNVVAGKHMLWRRNSKPLFCIVAAFIDFMLLIIGAPSFIGWICDKLGI